MKFFIALFAVLGVALIGSAVAPAVAIADSGYAVAAAPGGTAPPTGQLDVNIDVNEGGGAWWANPVWIAIGGIALVLLIVIIAMAARGGGTTVIKD
jgi:hypothetical protein